MVLDEQIDVLTRQEAVLQFESFGADDAWRLGSSMRQRAKSDPRPAAMGIWVAGQMLFYAATNGVVPSNEDWLRRKRNTVLRFGKSSLRMGLELQRSETTLEVKQGLTLAEYAAHGGGFPIALRGTGCVGAVVVSGWTQPEDHALVVSAMAAILSVEIPELTL
jgi:uncharacterized protein (UPF0303 family)